MINCSDNSVRLIRGIATYCMPASDEKGDWVATVPIYENEKIPSSDNCFVMAVASIDNSKTYLSTKETEFFNFNDILICGSIRAKKTLKQVFASLEALSQKGSLAYSQTTSRKLSNETLSRIFSIARTNGIFFESNLIPKTMLLCDSNESEAPHPEILRVPINVNLQDLSLEHQVLVLITRRIIECALPVIYNFPDISTVPDEYQALPWRRRIKKFTVHWSDESERFIGFKPISKEVSSLYYLNQSGEVYSAFMTEFLSEFSYNDLKN